jgi:phytoene dehydrogenase-like protein
LDLLTARLAAAGGVLRRNSTVQAILSGPSGVRGVRLEDGTEWEAPQVLSSAGWVETARLAGLHTAPSARGWVSLFESMWILKSPCRALGMAETVHFYCNQERMPWSMPESLVEERSGVLCASDNYASTEPPKEGLLRATTIANHDLWCALEEPEYVAAKARCSEQLAQHAARLGIDPRAQVIDADSFTPRTIRRYTAHERGSVYGSPTKHRDGRTPIHGLYLIGNDQGLVGITGALLSGITMANQHLLYALQP